MVTRLDPNIQGKTEIPPDQWKFLNLADEFQMQVIRCLQPDFDFIQFAQVMDANEAEAGEAEAGEAEAGDNEAEEFAKEAKE